MSNKFVRISGILLLALFVGGALLLPAVHMIHRASDGEAHEPENCAICQMTCIPIISSVPEIAPETVSISVRDVILPFDIFLPCVLENFAHTRAPPVNA